MRKSKPKHKFEFQREFMLQVATLHNQNWAKMNWEKIAQFFSNYTLYMQLLIYTFDDYVYFIYCKCITSCIFIVFNVYLIFFFFSDKTLSNFHFVCIAKKDHKTLKRTSKILNKIYLSENRKFLPEFDSLQSKLNSISITHTFFLKIR